MNFIILFMSKNNYDLLDHWIEVCKDFNKPNIINLDLGSNVDQVKYGKRLCEENNIDFLTAEKTQFQDNIRQVFNKEKLERWAHLTIHSTLHLLGYTHDNKIDQENMENTEIDILRKFDIFNPYEI